jgi:hypothetical protein
MSPIHAEWFKNCCPPPPTVIASMYAAAPTHLAGEFAHVDDPVPVEVQHVKVLAHLPEASSHLQQAHHTTNQLRAAGVQQQKQQQ